jgi:hypothetical protein
VKSYLSKMCIGLALIGSLCTVRPAFAGCVQQPPSNPGDPFDNVINYVRSVGNCFRCEGETTIINLVLAAQAAHNAGDVATCRLRIQAALMCAQKPSREFVFVNPNNHGQLLDETQGGVKVPISEYFSTLAGGPVPIYAIFSYQLPTTPFSLNLDRAKDCGSAGAIPAQTNTVILLTIALGSC